jgi:type 1 glutamine amidotransferase
MAKIRATLVCGGKWHDFDYARLQLLGLLADHEHVRTAVTDHYENLERLAATDVLITYTCDLRPSAGAQDALRAWVENGGRWLALHGTNSAIDPPAVLGQGDFTTPRAIPVLADTLGSQFLSHPKMGPYRVTVSPGAEHDPLVAGLEPFDAGDDELYLCEYHGTLTPLLETRWTGTETPGFAESNWPVDEPRLVAYRRPLGSGEVLYYTLGHCRSRFDMGAPPFNGMEWPRTERGSWVVPTHREILRRAIAWVAGTDPS